MKYYNKLTNKGSKYLREVAINKFVKSEYLRNTTSILPLHFLSFLTRTIFNFLISSRLKTDIYVFDFLFSLIITILLSLYSPFFYDLFRIYMEDDAKAMSSNFIDSLWNEGFIYIEKWRVRIMGTLGTLCIIVLFFVEVNSRMIQEIIVHMMISSAIVDYLSLISERNKEKKEKKEISNSPLSVKILTSPKQVLLTTNDSYKNIHKIGNDNNNSDKKLVKQRSTLFVIEDYKKK